MNLKSCSSDNTELTAELKKNTRRHIKGDKKEVKTKFLKLKFQIKSLYKIKIER